MNCLTRFMNKLNGAIEKEYPHPLEGLEEEDYGTIESCKQAIKIDPDFALAHNNLKAIQEKC